MGAKITITGSVLNRRKVSKGKNSVIYCFEFEEGGSPAPPKGLPPASKVEYTALLNEKQYNRLIRELGDLGVDFDNARFLVQGEITLDQPMDLVEGEIGIITFNISCINKPKDTQKGE